ncbi:hypothetical protein Tco_1569541, partial [Tanacetum coccineum]
IFFLGLQVKQKEDGIFISLDKYVGEILKKFGFSSIRTANTFMETNKALTKDEDGEDVDIHLYRSMIGSLMYLTSSRLDIMFSVCACSRFQVQPKVSHLNAVKRIFRYLKGRPKLGLWYPKDSPFILEAFSDSDYAGASLDRKSTTRGCQFLGSRLISWQCKKKNVVANSTTKAEYIAASHCCGQNPVYHSKTKHIEIRHHFIRDSYEKKLIEMVKIHTDYNVADLLTKAFDVTRFQFLIASIGSVSTAVYICIGVADRSFICGEDMADRMTVFSVLVVHHTTNGNQFTMSNRQERIGCSRAKDNCTHLSVLFITSIQMAHMDFCDKHNIEAFLQKPTGSEEFHQIVDFLAGSHIRYALTTNPTIYVSLIEQFWQTATVETVNDGEQQITVTVDGQTIAITEASVRRHLQLADADGISSLPNTEIFEQLTLIGYVSNDDKLTFQKVILQLQSFV